jgi:hypothetical protein
MSSIRSLKREGVMKTLFKLFRYSGGRLESQTERLNPLRLKPEIFEAICMLHGWHGRGKQARFAEELHITRYLVNRLLNEPCPISAQTLCDIARILGLFKQDSQGRIIAPELGNLAYIDPTVVANSHPVYNYPKYRQERPYNRLSVAAMFRRIDNPELEQENDTPLLLPSK